MFDSTPHTLARDLEDETRHCRSRLKYWFCCWLGWTPHRRHPTRWLGDGSHRAARGIGSSTRIVCHLWVRVCHPDMYAPCSARYRRHLRSALLHAGRGRKRAATLTRGCHEVYPAKNVTLY